MCEFIKKIIVNEDNWFKFESGLSKFENSLSRISGLTVVLAPVTGPLKIMMGIVQFVAGGILLLSSFGTQLKGDAEFTESLKRHSVEHIKHGFYNILAGASESIPFVSSIFFFARVCEGPISSIGIGLQTDVEMKFRQYESIEKRSMKFVEGDCESENPAKMKNVNQFFSLAYSTNEDRDKATLAQMKQDAKLSIDFANVNYPNIIPPHADVASLINQYNENRRYQAIRLNLDGNSIEKIVFTKIRNA